MTIVLAIIGSRTFTDYSTLCKFIEGYTSLGITIGGIVSGGAKGADSLAKRYADENGIPLLEFIPNWDKYGKAAGMIRNRDIIDAADEVLAFWDGTSRGTKNSIDYARKKKVPVVVAKV